MTAAFRDRLRIVIGLAAFAAALVAVFALERRETGLVVTETLAGETPVTLFRTALPGPRPLVVIAHGYGGSRQMMTPIALALARAGFAAATFDFPGHGRHPGLMSRDVTSIEGTTAQLVATTREVTAALRARAEIDGPVALVGHSMATDVVIRATLGMEGAGAIGAISMYSDAVTAGFPERLLIISGATEERLRKVALEALRQVDSAATEGATARSGAVERRAAVAPWVGHVGVLYSQTTLNEMTAWLTGETAADGAPPAFWMILLLAAVGALAWPLSTLLPAKQARPAPALPLKDFVIALALPVLPMVAAAQLAPAGLGPAAGFAALAWAFAAWGLVQALWLRWQGVRLSGPDFQGSAALLAFGLGVFGLALDRYGAAFLPAGPRLSVMAVLALGTIPLMMADAHLTAGAALWRRVIARVALIAAIAGAMALAPLDLGLTFTVLPVLVLFSLVYGTFARFAAARRGVGVWLGTGIALAWALAATTPLFEI